MIDVKCSGQQKKRRFRRPWAWSNTSPAARAHESESQAKTHAPVRPVARHDPKTSWPGAGFLPLRQKSALLFFFHLLFFSSQRPSSHHRMVLI
jgi:hypothetical protein